MELRNIISKSWTNEKIQMGIKLFLMTCWFGGAIKDSSVTTSIYLIILICAAAELLLKRDYPLSMTRFEKYLWCFFSVLFSVITYVACDSQDKMILNAVIELLGGIISFKWFIHLGYRLLETYQFPLAHKSKEKGGANRYFLTCMGAVFIIDILFLFLVVYPGTLTIDSISQITQIENGSYSDNHPYWHTQMVRFWYLIGKKIFGTVEGGVILFLIFQIIIMALCFGYSILTISEMGANKKAIMAAMALYIIAPYNISYSSSLWKDVLFSHMVLLVCTSLIRLTKNIGGLKGADYFLLIIGCFGTALLRHNGFYALFVFPVFCLLLLKKKGLIIAIIIAGVVFSSTILQHQLLEKGTIEPGEKTESLAIPIQQIARVVAYDGELTTEQINMIDKVIDHNEILTLYNPHIVDSVKFRLDMVYLEEHLNDFFYLWMDVGKNNPDIYIRAWIEETKGYWNAGYQYWVWTKGLSYPEDVGKELGLKSTVTNTLHSRVLWEYWNFFLSDYPVDIFLGIGIHVWIVVLLGIYSALHGNKETTIIVILDTLIIGTLLVASPVYSEFRYAYCIFTTFPLIVISALCRL